jgi:hypothetical protein
MPTIEREDLNEGLVWNRISSKRRISNSTDKKSSIPSSSDGTKP